MRVDASLTEDLVLDTLQGGPHARGCVHPPVRGLDGEAGRSRHTLESLEAMLGGEAASLDDALRDVLDN